MCFRNLTKESLKSAALQQKRLDFLRNARENKSHN